MKKPDVLFYPNFFSEKESRLYFTQLSQEIPWQQKTIKLFGRDMLEPRLTSWHGDPQAFYTYSGVKLNPLPWTPALNEIKIRVENMAHVPFNSVLLNLYRDHRDSMGLHSDDEKELGPQPIIASVSFGAPRRFVLKSRLNPKEPPHSYLLTAGSLLIMRGSTQSEYKHGVPKEKTPCDPRINLTFRHILQR